MEFGGGGGVGRGAAGVGVDGGDGGVGEEGGEDVGALGGLEVLGVVGGKCEEQGVARMGGCMGNTYDEAGSTREGYGRHLECGRACDEIAMSECYAVKKKSGDEWPLSCLYMNQARY